MAGAATDGEPHVLIEANIDEGVVSAPLSKYLHCQTRICRPVGLTLQLPFLKISESMGNHDSKIVGACSVD